MISNLRSRPIQGYVTDSAGNIIRNTNIVVYRGSPDGLVAVDRAQSDDEGYFVSSPLQNGVYDIFESGVRTSRIIHNADQNDIQAFKASEDNYFGSETAPFSVLTAAKTLNEYVYYIQIEPEDISVDVYGNMFPIYNKDLSIVTIGVDDMFYLKNFFSLRPDSRITISRFDIEYFLPLTATQSSYRRIKWAGVPGIRFKADSKIVIPLDYYSIVANNPFKTSTNGDAFPSGEVTISAASGADPNTLVTVLGSSSNASYVDVYNTTGIGDIVKLTTSTKTWYGIVVSKSLYSMILEKWKSSRFVKAGDTPIVTDIVERINTYHGMFQGLASMSSTVSDYFTVVENLYQQTGSNELYNYSGV